jgi:hypothetical protein
VICPSGKSVGVMQHRHCEERSDEAIHSAHPIDGLLRFARNDVAVRCFNNIGVPPLPLWERVGVRGSGLSIVRNPSPGATP